jgi:hypothetical protein
MTITEALMIFSALFGPVIAVQITRYLDDKNEVKSRKLKVFKTLMATRAYTLSIAHVEALNRIDLEFSKDNPKEKNIIEHWIQYLDILGNKALSPEQWAIKRIDALVELLYSMGQSLGYDFDKTHIKNASYSPVAHGRIEEDQEKLRSYLLELLEGNRTLPMRVTNIPDTAPI